MSNEFEIEVRNAVAKLSTEVRGLGKGIESVAAQFRKAGESAKEMTHEERVEKYARRLKEAEANAKALAEAQKQVGQHTKESMDTMDTTVTNMGPKIAGVIATVTAALAGLAAAEGQVREAQRKADQSTRERAQASFSVGDAARMAGIADSGGVADYAASLEGSISQEALNAFARNFQGSVGKTDEATFKRALRARSLLGLRGGNVAAGNLAMLGGLGDFSGLPAAQQAAIADEFTARSGGFSLGDAQVTAVKNLIGGGATMDQALNVLASAANAGKAGKVEKFADNAGIVGFNAAMAGNGLSPNDLDVLREVQAGLQAGAFPRALARSTDPFLRYAEMEAFTNRQVEVAKFRNAAANLPGAENRLDLNRNQLIYDDVMAQDLAARGVVGAVPNMATRFMSVLPGVGRDVESLVAATGDAMAPLSAAASGAASTGVPMAQALPTSAGPFGAGSVTPEAWAALFRMMFDYFSGQDSKKLDPITVKEEP